MENRRVPGWGCDLHLVHQIERGGIFARGWEGLSFGSFGTKHKTHLQSLSNILMHFSSKKFIDVKRTFYVQLHMFLVKSKSIKYFFSSKKNTFRISSLVLSRHLQEKAIKYIGMHLRDIIPPAVNELNMALCRFGVLLMRYVLIKRFICPFFHPFRI